MRSRLTKATIPVMPTKTEAFSLFIIFSITSDLFIVVVLSILLSDCLGAVDQLINPRL